MSKALSALAVWAATTSSGPAESPMETAGGPQLQLLAGGICVLAGWGLLRILRPHRLLLRRVPGRPNHLSILHVAAVFLVYAAAAKLATLAVARWAGIEARTPEQTPIEVALAGTILGQVVMIGGVLAVAATTFRHGLRRGLGMSLRHVVWDALRAMIGCLAVLPLCIGALGLTRLLIPPGLVHEHPALAFLPEASTPWLIVVLLATVVLAPLAEELFFRGLLESMLRQYVRSPWWAILGASVLFALIHAPQYQDMPALMILGAALGYNYERTGRLIAPILLHALFNAAMIWTALGG